MSYQPQPPMGPAPYAPMGAPAAPPAAAPASRSRGLLFVGIALLVLGVGTGAVLYALSGSTEEETVEKFARAPAGCTTTLQFDKAGVFTIYVETKGSVSDPGGDCAANGGSYERADDDLPRATLTLVDEANAVQTLVDSRGPSYDVGGYRGQATQQVRIPAKGTYRLTVTSDSTDFAIAIGGEPDADSSTMKTGGMIAALLGLVLGGLLTVLALRKKSGPATAPPAATGWTPTTGVPGATPQYGGVPGAVPQQPAYPPQQPSYQPQQPTYQPQPPSAPPQPTYQPQPPSYQPQQPPPAAPSWAPQQPAPPAEQHDPPTAPPAPPQGPGWGAPQ